MNTPALDDDISRILDAAERLRAATGRPGTVSSIASEKDLFGDRIKAHSSIQLNLPFDPRDLIRGHHSHKDGAEVAPLPEFFSSASSEGQRPLKIGKAFSIAATSLVFVLAPMRVPPVCDLLPDPLYTNLCKFTP